MNPTSRFQRFAFLFACVALPYSMLATSAQEMAQQERQTAAQHANFATKAMSISETHLHLHHVINCLVGPGGADFDAGSGNPCKGQGNGALNAMNLSMEEKQTLERALALAKQGTEINNQEAAHDKAQAVKELLQGNM